MFTHQMQRRQIEHDILSLARKVDTEDARWHSSEAFSQLIDAWQKLAEYYETSHDRTVDAHVLKVYMRFAVMLRRAGENARTMRQRQQAKAALQAINAPLDAVFSQIERNGGARTAV